MKTKASERPAEAGAQFSWSASSGTRYPAGERVVILRNGDPRAQAALSPAEARDLARQMLAAADAAEAGR